MTTDNKNGKLRSDLIKTGPDHAPARAMLRATGLDDAAIAKPLIGIVHSWSNVSPCNLNLRDLAVAVEEGWRVGWSDVSPVRSANRRMSRVAFSMVSSCDGIVRASASPRPSRYEPAGAGCAASRA